MATTAQRKAVEQRLRKSFAPLSVVSGFIGPVTKQKAASVNAVMRVSERALLATRIHIENQLQAELEAHVQEYFALLLRQMVRDGGMTRIEDDAARLATSIHRPGMSPAAHRRATTEYLAGTKKDDRLMLGAMGDSARTLNLNFESDKYFQTADALWYESGAKYVTDALEDSGLLLAKTLRECLRRGMLIRKDIGDVVGGFAAEDLFMVELMIESVPEVMEAIAARTNQITVKAFTEAMFDTMRQTMTREMYEKFEGASGARALASELGKDLVSRYGTSLPAITKDKLMLWSRTEGCILQNDALMKIGTEAGMNGKQWSTVGDERVRDAHSDNESDGVIPIGDSFSDGSMDAGSGSNSPYRCRCVGGPALLSKAATPSK